MRITYFNNFTVSKHCGQTHTLYKVSQVAHTSVKVFHAAWSFWRFLITISIKFKISTFREFIYTGTFYFLFLQYKF